MEEHSRLAKRQRNARKARKTWTGVEAIKDFLLLGTVYLPSKRRSRLHENKTRGLQGQDDLQWGYMVDR